MSSSALPDVSRRGFLLSGLAGVSLAALPGAASRAAADLPIGGPLPTVKPIWSQRAYEAFGVCCHPNFGQTGYQYTADWVTALALTGASYFRGMYAHQLPATTATTGLARDHGLAWGMTVCPDLSFSDAQLVSRIRHIARNAADVCHYVEGVNEPNHVRGGGSPPADWVKRTVAKQKVIWQTVRSEPSLAHVKVVGPALHAVEGTESQYRALRDAGVVRYMEYAGLHRYHGGRYPDHLLDQRLAWVKKYWGGKPVWITETGYTNALARDAGHNPVPEDVSAAYAPSALLEAVDRSCQVTWYELLDDPDGLVMKDEIESNFGMYAAETGAGPPWRPKPVVAVMKAFLARLEDPGPTYNPPRIGLRISSDADDLRSTVVAKRDGTATLHLRRATNCWDPVAQERTLVLPVPVLVETANGVRTVAVDHNVQSVPL